MGRVPFENQDIEDARNMAISAHGDQKYGDKPYVWHLDAVAQLCEQYGTKATIVAFLHDTLEDTQLSPQVVEDRFGNEIRQLVEALTDPPGKNRKERKAESYRKLGEISANSDKALALVIKAADRLANVRSCVSDRNTRLFSMYENEHAAFSIAVFRPGLNDGLMNELNSTFESLTFRGS